MYFSYECTSQLWNVILRQEEDKKDGDKEKDKNEADNKAKDATVDKTTDSADKSKEKDVSSSSSEKKDENDKKELEPTFELLSNPARVMKAQVRYSKLTESSVFSLLVFLNYW